MLCRPDFDVSFCFPLRFKEKELKRMASPKNWHNEAKDWGLNSCAVVAARQNALP